MSTDSLIINTSYEPINKKIDRFDKELKEAIEANKNRLKRLSELKGIKKCFHP